MLCTGQMIHTGLLLWKVMVDRVRQIKTSVKPLLIAILFSIDGAKPGDSTNIYIPRGIWLVVDYPLPRIQALRIDGVLEFEQVFI